MQAIQTFFSATHLQQIVQIKEVYSLLTQLEDETNTDGRVRYVAANVKLYHRMRDIDDVLTKEFKKANKITDRGFIQNIVNYLEMTNQEIRAFALEHHAEMQEKGFWNDKSMVKKSLLIARELGESLEAHRKNKRCSIAISIFENKNFENELIRTKFEGEVKDTFEDKTADTMLRLLDFSIHFDKLFYNLIDLEYFAEISDMVLRKISKVKSDYDVTELDALLFTANRYALEFEMTRLFVCLLEIAKLINFDLWEHVKAKRLYNQTRSTVLV